MLLYHSLAAALPLLSLSAAQTWPSDIVGTWTTKSNKTITGPVCPSSCINILAPVLIMVYLQSFYDPLNDEFIEPERTGISYSFTEDGHYEEAYYRAIANPQDPSCPSGIMQWQHGSWVMNANNSLSLTPIGVDGRQLMSEPCKYSKGVYTRYNQSELMEVSMASKTRT